MFVPFIGGANARSSISLRAQHQNRKMVSKITSASQSLKAHRVTISIIYFSDLKEKKNYIMCATTPKITPKTVRIRKSTVLFPVIWNHGLLGFQRDQMQRIKPHNNAKKQKKKRAIKKTWRKKHKIVVIYVRLMAGDYVVMFKRTRKLLAFHRCFILKRSGFEFSYRSC